MAPALGVSPIPPPVRDELKRVVARWHQLPLDRALSHSPRVRGVAQSWAEDLPGCRARRSTALPDLGPATLMDQLQVMVYDLFTAQPDRDPATVLTQLTGIRRSL